MKSEFQERIRSAREGFLALSLLTFCLAFLLGIATNIATDYLQNRYPKKYVFLVAATATVILGIIFLWQVYSRWDTTSTVIEIVLPFQVGSDQAKILPATPYPFTTEASNAFRLICKEPQNEKAFIQDWMAARAKKHPFQGSARKCVIDLQAYLILKAINKFSERTFGSKRLFVGDRPHVPELPDQKVEARQWPSLLQENLCIRAGGAQAIQTIKIPSVFRLEAIQNGEKDGKDMFEVILHSKYGRVKFAVSPFSQKLSLSIREGKILHKHLPSLTQKNDLYLAKFYIRLSAELGGWRIFSRTFREDFLPWVERLFDCLEEELNWQRCVESDVERMIVALSAKVEALQAAQLNQSTPTAVGIAQAKANTTEVP